MFELTFEVEKAYRYIAQVSAKIEGVGVSTVARTLNFKTKRVVRDGAVGPREYNGVKVDNLTATEVGCEGAGEHRRSGGTTLGRR